MTEYQGITINGVEYVEGTDRSADYDIVFKEPPTDKTILDLGCYMGYYAIRALAEGGAKCAIGIDTNADALTTGAEIANKVGVVNRLKLLPQDFWEFYKGNRFDIVLCLSVLHHFDSIARVYELLDLMNGWARERMVFTVRIPDNPDQTHNYRVNDNGKTKLDLSLKFFQERFPDYKITATEAPSYIKRHIIDIKKV